MADLNEEQLSTQFQQLGLQEKKVKEILKNKKVSKALADIIEELPSTENVNCTLLHSLASLSKDASEESLPYRKFVTLAIADGRLKTNLQLDGKANASNFSNLKYWNLITCSCVGLCSRK